VVPLFATQCDNVELENKQTSKQSREQTLHIRFPRSNFSKHHHHQLSHPEMTIHETSRNSMVTHHSAPPSASHTFCVVVVDDDNAKKKSADCAERGVLKGTCDKKKKQTNKKKGRKQTHLLVEVV
jgi:hypothetical protein